MSQPSAPRPSAPYFWLWMMCLLGVDYFSTLAYQPSITYQMAGLLGPVATIVVVLATLGGALPVYSYVGGRSPRGLGSIAMLERLIHGWRGKSLVLLLLGFAATDFVMVKTISLADAAVHVLGNPFNPWQEGLESIAEWTRGTGQEVAGDAVASYFDKQLITTLLLGVLGFVFWFLLRRGFNRNVIFLAVPLVALYLVLNAVILISGCIYLSRHPDLFSTWLEQIARGDWNVPRETWFIQGAELVGGWVMVAVLCVVLFPLLTLGLSGFELSLILMPGVKGDDSDGPEHPRGRVRNTRKMLVVATVIMSVYLLGSVLVCTLLIPSEELLLDGRASNRALAYLAHGGRLATGDRSLGPWFGSMFGTVYDVVTVLLLSLAGTSVMTALANLLPRFLFRFGMQFPRAQRWGVLLILFALVNLLVTLWFRASVTDQRGAYATAVLVLFSSASLATFLDRKQHVRESAAGGLHVGRKTLDGFFGLVALLFCLTTAAVAVRAPGGLLIAGCFIIVLFVSSVITRAVRAQELRTIGFEFKDTHSRFLWDSLRLADFPVLVPIRPGGKNLLDKEREIREHHNLDPEADVVFLQVELEDPSNFLQSLLIEVLQENKRFVIKVMHSVSVAQAIAAVALEMSKESKPPSLHFGWSEMNLLEASWSYFAFGEGNVPWKVRELIVHTERNPDRRPRVIVG
jgi:hypothetical protein